MAAYEQFAEERNKIDSYIKQQYRITAVREDLSGTRLTLEHPGGDRTELLVLTADARKHLANVLIRQRRGS
ncbi:hypothetical protein L1N85_18235 [Paenibacillus alkaliterrae]|uniref:hypothetical protein n=1 Tax=Paenibacillus alkaliterrae TaxID=320909 RepID=UPI001F34EBB1|nr:hypothetical protein [Paenibacillus alkaliterrae]MCF2940344.1 hypothetical protein [Paenibacillus alkaliterrae]